MQFDTFLLERNQSEFENEVEINLTESGVHALSMRELLAPDEIERMLDVHLSYGFTEGTPGLRRAVASWHPGATLDNVLITTGTSEANLVALLTAGEVGDDIIVVIPNFMQISGLARGLGMMVHETPLVEERGWKLDREALRAALSPRTRMITLCNPNNPTGKCMEEDDIAFLVAAAEETGAVLVVDEIYRGAELNGRPETPSFWGRSPNVVITGSTAKSFAHPGLRIGWVVAQPDFIYQCMRRQDYTTIGTSPLCQAIAEIILQPARREALFSRSRRILTDNLGFLQHWMSKRSDLSLTPPEAGGMAFVRYTHKINSTELSRRLRELESVFIVAGDWFGLDGRLRIGIGGEQEKLANGLARFGRFLDGLN